MIHATLLDLARSYHHLPDMLDPATAYREAPARVMPPVRESKVPIRVDVSDVIRDIELFAGNLEDALRQTFSMGTVYWSTTRHVAVQRSLEWSAAIFEHPPIQMFGDGVEREGLIPDGLLDLATVHADRLQAACGHIFGTYRGLAPTSCPRCGKRALFTSPVESIRRCVACHLVQGEL